MFAFTEQGVAMLASILKSDRARAASIMIMRAFVAMRRFLVANAQIFQRLDRLDRKQLENEQNFEKVFAKFEENEPVRQGIFFDGQTYDAYTFVSDHIREAKSRIVLIDNYNDDNIYHFWASIKDLGKKWFAVTPMTEYTANELLHRL